MTEQKKETTPQEALAFLVQVCGQVTGIPLIKMNDVNAAAFIIDKALKPNPVELPEPKEKPDDNN